MKKIDEKELHSIFSEFKNRNQAAYNELYEKYYKLVYGIAFSVLKNKEDSEDITNEVFTKIYKLDKEKLPVSNEASWLFTVTRNECFSHLRKSRLNISIDEIYDIPSDSKEIQEIVDTEYYNKLISGLSEQEKTIVSLKVLSNFTFSKISQVMNIPIGTVQWKYYKAINSLKVSIGSLAGAIIAFVFAFVGRDKFSNKTYLKSDNYINDKKEEVNNIETDAINNNAESTQQEVPQSLTSSDVKENDAVEGNKSSTIKDINMGEMKESDNVTESVMVPQADSSEESSNINVYNISLISIGIMFLIIFAIFFKKYQQKLNRKASK